MAHTTLILYHHTFMLALHTSLISCALLLPRTWYQRSYNVHYIVHDFQFLYTRWSIMSIKSSLSWLVIHHPLASYRVLWCSLLGLLPSSNGLRVFVVISLMYMPCVQFRGHWFGTRMPLRGKASWGKHSKVEFNYYRPTYATSNGNYIISWDINFQSKK